MTDLTRRGFMAASAAAVMTPAIPNLSAAPVREAGIFEVMTRKSYRIGPHAQMTEVAYTYFYADGRGNEYPLEEHGNRVPDWMV